MPTEGSRIEEQELSLGVPGAHVATKPPYKLDTTLALTAILLKRKSLHVIAKVEASDKTYTVTLEDQSPDSISVQVALQGCCPVEASDDKINANWDLPTPTMFLHPAGKRASIDRGVDILCFGLEHSSQKPHGIYSTAADIENASRMLASYDGGCAVAFTSDGFIANISEITASGKKRNHKLDWIRGCPPGVILFRRMMSGLDQYIHNKQSTRIRYVLFDKTGLDSFLQTEFRGDDGRW